MAELGDLLSVSEFAFEGDDAALMRYLAGAEPSCRVWRACEGGGVRIDGATSTLPLESEVAVSTLRCTLSVPGAAAGTDAPFHYVVETDVPPEHAADFDAWYTQEHLPGLAAVPGTVLAQRWVRVSGEGPRHVACYDLASLDTFGSPGWLAVRATPWSDRVRPTFRNTRRRMYRRLLR